MSECISGFAFHLHHDSLMEWCTDYQERVDYIKTNKPAREQELRFRLFKIIPPARLPPSLLEARKICDEARKACNEAWEAYDEARASLEPEILKLHSELCPNCTWDGRTIFSGKGV